MAMSWLSATAIFLRNPWAGAVCVDGHRGTELLDAILALFPLDQFVEAPVTVMAPAPGAMDGNPPIWAEFAEIVEKHQPGTKSEAIDRFAFYDRAKNAYATVATGENALTLVSS